MIYCLSCKRYPEDPKVIPSGSTFPINCFMVRLISDETPSTMPTSGTDIENLADGTLFAVGSILYVINGSSGSEVYVYVDNEFKLWDSPVPIEL